MIGGLAYSLNEKGRRKMKRIALTVISVCLVLASVFGLVAASVGLGDITDILRKTNLQNDDIRDSIALISERYAEIKEKDGDKTAKDYATAVVTEKYGSGKIDAGQKEYDEGKAQLDAGQKEYDAAKAKLDQGKADYAAAEKLIAQKEKEIADGEKQIADAEAQLAEAKKQRDEGQAKLDRVTPLYNKVKPIYGNISGTEVGDAISGILQKNGYNTVGELLADYEAAQAQLADANKQIADAELQIEQGKQQIADGKEQLAAGKEQLAAAKQQLDEGEKQLAAGKAQLDDGKAQLADAAEQLAAGKRKMANNSATMANELETLEEMDGAQEIVDAGIKILLANDGIAEKVSNREDYDEVLAAASEFVEQEAENVQQELSVRQQLYSLLRILSVVCIVAGAMGAIAAFRPKYQTLIIAFILSCAAALSAVALNIYGYVNDYRYFVYSLGEGDGDGSLQFAAMIAILIAALLAALICLACTKAYKRGVAAPVAAAPAVAKPAKAARAEKPKRVKKTDEDEDDEGWQSIKPEKAEDKAAEAQVVKPEPKTEAASGEIPANLIERMQAQTKRLNEETERMESESRRKDFEEARREYEEALRKFEEARKRSN